MKTANALLFCIGFGAALAVPVYAEDVIVVKGASSRIAVAEGVRRISVANPMRGRMVTGVPFWSRA